MADHPHSININSLFERYGEKLGLSWIGGKQGGERLIVPEEPHGHSALHQQQPAGQHDTTGLRSLVGCLNLIHPHQVQILGALELEYLSSLHDLSLGEALNQLFQNHPACILLAEEQKPPSRLSLRCNEIHVALFSSPLPSYRLASMLRYYLADMLAETVILNGVFMEVMDTGVLITGPSGVGKSELALELIARGHRLVADDATKFSRVGPEQISGTCPEILQDFLEVRGLGIINVRSTYGDSSIKDEKLLRLIVRLEAMERSRLLQLDRLDGGSTIQNILDVEIPEITLPVAPGRNLAVLLECAVRNHILKIRGYNAPADFINKQQRLVNQNDD
jgi:HPr kinase/phosphorylase